MGYRLLADLTLTLHFAFLAFVVGGGLLARRWRWIAVPHLLAVAWGVYVELMPGLLCPLTTWENALALSAGEAGYEGGFIEHYLMPVIYPDGLTPTVQRTLAVLVIAVNIVVYTWPRTREGRKPEVLGRSASKPVDG
jgi:Protein of Unknown function (DUF2784)